MGNHVFWPDGDFSAAPTAESGRSFQRVLVLVLVLVYMYVGVGIGIGIGIGVGIANGNRR